MLGLQDSLANTKYVNRLTWRAAGTFRNLHLRCFTPVGAGVTVPWAFEKNGVDTALAVTLSGSVTTDYQNTTDAVHVDVGDVVQWHPRLTAASTTLPGTRIALCVEFDSDVPNECCYGRGPRTCINNRYSPIFHQHSRDTYTDPHEAKDLMGVPGNITELFAATQIAAGAGGTDLAPGAGKWFEVALYKNHVRQDGTGGTVDTVCRISNTSVNNLSTFTLPVVAGDLIYLRETNSGGLSPFLNWRGSIKFVSTDEDTFSIISVTDPGTSTTNASYIPPNVELGWSPSVTESQNVMVGPITPLTLGGMIGDIETGPGDPTESIQYHLRVNGVDSGVFLEFVGTQTTDQVGGSVELTSTDLWTIRKIGTGLTPGGGGGQVITFPGVSGVEEPPEEGTIIVEKVAPDDPDQIFSFDTVNLTPALFSLHDGESRSFSGLTPDDGYSVVENVPDGWTVAYAVSNESPNTNISVAADEVVVVTVTNTPIPPEPEPPPDEDECVLVRPSTNCLLGGTPSSQTIALTPRVTSGASWTSTHSPDVFKTPLVELNDDDD
jgi:hypothetical protein